MRGGVLRLEDGVPVLRNVRDGRPAAGRGWIGLTPRNAYETRDVRQTPLLLRQRGAFVFRVGALPLVCLVVARV